MTALKTLFCGLTLLLVIAACATVPPPAPPPVTQPTTAVQPTSAPPPTSAPQATAASQPTAAAGQSLLDDLMKRGKMVCATSADFPPYESKDASGEFVGFDMDLIREVGKRMGVQVEIQDMAFDSIIASVQAKKVDCAIAALAGTPERNERVEFSISYKPRADAILVRTDGNVVLNSAADLANYRVGAQSGGSSSAWIQKNLVDTGKMPADRFRQYERGDQAVLDLKAGRIDAALTQPETAAQYTKEGDLKIGLITTELVSTTDTVIIMPKGELALKAKIDEALKQIIDDGSRNQLLTKYEIPIPK